MRAIHVANEKRRDAEVAFDGRFLKPAVRYVLRDGREKINVRILKSTIQMDTDALLERYGTLEDVARALLESDPEIDMEVTGKKLNRTHRLWVGGDGKIAFRVNLFRLILDPGGSPVEKKDVNKLPGNVNKEVPLKWTGKFYPKGDVIRMFVFTRKYQIRHINGATFDFLYNMAKELHDRDSMVLIGGGSKGTDPILLSRGGQPYRGFLEGRIHNDRYILILHLSDIELKGLDE